MKKTKLIGIIILILVMFLAIVLAFIANLTILKKDGTDLFSNTSTNQIVNNINNDNIKDSMNNTNITNISTVNTISENTNTSITENDDTDDVFYSDEETGDAQYTTEQLNNFSFEIKGLTNDILKYIKNIDNFNITIKEYVYKHGLVDATIAEVQKYEYQESTKRLGIIFKLNNPDEDKFRVIVSSDDKIEISNYE